MDEARRSFTAAIVDSAEEEVEVGLTLPIPDPDATDLDIDLEESIDTLALVVWCGAFLRPWSYSTQD